MLLCNRAFLLSCNIRILYEYTEYLSGQSWHIQSQSKQEIPNYNPFVGKVSSCGLQADKASSDLKVDMITQPVQFSILLYRVLSKSMRCFPESKFFSMYFKNEKHLPAEALARAFFFSPLSFYDFPVMC